MILKIDSEGGKHWYKEIVEKCEFFSNSTLKRNLRHREDGPAVEWANGTKEWRVNDKLHREHGPAIEWANGSKEWYLHGELHREGGPAIERFNGDKLWYIHGMRHREDGPATIFADGSKSWYIKNKRLDCSSQEEFERIIKLIAFW